MNFTNTFLLPLSPAICLTASAVWLMMAECFSTKSLQRTKFVLAITGPVAAIIAVFFLSQMPPATVPSSGIGVLAKGWLAFFHQSFHSDSTVLLVFLCIAAFILLSVVLFRGYFSDAVFFEAAILLLFSGTGMMLLVSANHMVVVYLALELLSLPTYATIALNRSRKISAEAALKYFLFGSLTSVFFLLGTAFLYTEFRTLSLSAIGALLSSDNPASFVTLAALAILTISFAFKVGLAPFHMWLPDVYDGAPGPVSGLMGSAIKLAAFAFFLRLFTTTFPDVTPGFSGVLTVLSVVSMFWGNLAALAQTNLKRMFAYSSIAHAGYITIGVISYSHGQTTSIWFYLITYAVMLIGVFAILSLFEVRQSDQDQSHSATLNEIAGLGFSNPWIGFALLVFTLSAAGLPPTSLFFAKYFIFADAVREGHTMLVILAVIASLIGAYYYIRVIVYLYMRDHEVIPKKLPLATQTQFVILTCSIALIFFIFMPGVLLF